jgi:hypothetical protein
MNSFPLKEKIVFSLCWLVAFTFLIMGLYQFFIQSLSGLELVNVFAVFLIFIGTGLAPKMFFTPLKELLSASHKQEALINAGVQQSIVLAGVVLTILCLVSGKLL